MPSHQMYTLLFSLLFIVIADNNNHIISITSLTESQDKNLEIGILTDLDLSSNTFTNSKLINPSIIQTPQINRNNLQFEIKYDNDDDKCFNDPNKLHCYQKLIIVSTNNDNQCPISEQGQFKIQFDILNTLTNEIYDQITLDTDITYEDSICDSKLFNIDDNDMESQLIKTQEMKFYKDAEYKIEMGKTLYDPEATCFAEVIIRYNDFDELFVKASLENVWICTSGIEITMDECDDNSLYWIIRNHEKETSLMDAAIISEIDYPDKKTTIIRFSFIIPKEIRTDSLYIENQVSLEIFTNDNKRLLLYSDINPINSILKTLTIFVIGYINIKNGIIFPYWDHKFIFIGKEWAIILEILTLMLILLALILIFIYCNCNNNNQIENENVNVDEDNIPLKQVEKEFIDFVDFEHDSSDPLDESY